MFGVEHEYFYLKMISDIHEMDLASYILTNICCCINLKQLRRLIPKKCLIENLNKMAVVCDDMEGSIKFQAKNKNDSIKKKRVINKEKKMAKK